MNSEQIQRHFERIGARVKFRPFTRAELRQPGRRGSKLAIDVATDHRGEYFDLARRPGAPSLRLLQALPKDRHLLLFSTDGERFLCGHDERHWFVAAVEQSVSTVRDAKRALVPRQLKGRVAGLKTKEAEKRRNRLFTRQGEWFFVPTRRRIRPDRVLRQEPLSRSSESKPHVCEQLYREGGELIYIVGEAEMTEREFQKACRRNRSFRHRWTGETRLRNPGVFVRGTVRHKDHATLHLDGWHRAFINNEATSRSVTFLD